MRDMSARLLEERTGKSVASWNREIKQQRLGSEKSLIAWLTKRGVTGYPRSLLVMEQFGYPDFYLASADELIDGQYADRPKLRPILDKVLDAAAGLGDVVIQSRKTFVSLVTSKRTFARVQPTTKTRVDLGLRIDGQRPKGRLKPSKLHDTMKLQIGLTSPADVDAEVLDWLQLAYDRNR